MKKSVLTRAIVALLFVIATVFAGVTPASATATTIAFDGAAPTFSAGGNSPVMGFVVNPGGNTFNRVRLEIYNSAGTAVETSGSIHMAMSGHNLSDCFTVLNSPLLGCTKENDDAGFFEYSNGTTSQISLQFNAGLFTLPSAAGNYTFRVGIYDGGTELSSATVGFTQSIAQYNITFSAGGGTGSQASITTNGPTFTLPANTFTPPSGKIFSGWNDPAVSNVILNAGDSYTVSRDTNLIPAWGNSGSNQQNQTTTFTTANSSFSRGSSPSFSTLAVGANVPAFTMTFSGFSGGAAIDQVNYLLGDPYHDVFWNVPGAVTNNNNNNYVSWSPSSSTCGITAIRLGGVAQTSGSGITCLQSTYVGSATQYWIALKFSTPTTTEISIDTAAGVFQVSQAGNLNYFATLMNNSVSPRLMSNITQAFDASVQSSPSAQQVSPVSFTIPVAPGQRIVGEDIAITATDLAVSTDYSVVLRSTPQILAQGRTVSSSFNTSVTIPDNLEAGWHSITFSATSSDGSALEEKVYFKINADGTLLASTTETPAELAFTGALTAGAIPLSIIALVMGFIAFFVAREINPDFMRVMTLTRNEDGELDFVKRRIRSIDF